MPTATDGVIEKAPRGLFERTGSGRYVLRLEVLTDRLDCERKFRRNGEKPELFAAKAIIAYPEIDGVMSLLEAHMRNQKEIEDSISLAYETQPVSWDQFFFRPGEHGKAFDRIVATNGVIPIAVHGRIERVCTRSDEESGTEFAMVDHPLVRRRSSNRTIKGVQLSLWHRHLSAFDGCVAGQELLSFGLWDQLVLDDTITVVSDRKVPSPLGVARLMALAPRQMRVVTHDNGVFRKLELLPKSRPPKRDGREQELEKY